MRKIITSLIAILVVTNLEAQQRTDVYKRQIQILPVRILYTRTEIIAGLVDISHLRSISAESHRLIHCEPPIIQTIGCVI